MKSIILSLLISIIAATLPSRAEETKPKKPLDTFTVWAPLIYDSTRLLCSSAWLGVDLDKTAYGQISQKNKDQISNCKMEVKKAENEARADLMNIQNSMPMPEESKRKILNFAHLYITSLNSLSLFIDDRDLYNKINEKNAKEIEEKANELKQHLKAKNDRTLKTSNK